jgi:hypothetical protein
LLFKECLDAKKMIAASRISYKYKIFIGRAKQRTTRELGQLDVINFVGVIDDDERWWYFFCQIPGWFAGLIPLAGIDRFIMLAMFTVS